MKLKINFYLGDPKMESTEINGELAWDVTGTIWAEDLILALMENGLTSTQIKEMAIKIESEL